MYVTGALEHRWDLQMLCFLWNKSCEIKSCVRPRPHLFYCEPVKKGDLGRIQCPYPLHLPRGSSGVFQSPPSYERISCTRLMTSRSKLYHLPDLHPVWTLQVSIEGPLPWSDGKSHLGYESPPGTNASGYWFAATNFSMLLEVTGSLSTNPCWVMLQTHQIFF